MYEIIYYVISLVEILVYKMIQKHIFNFFQTFFDQQGINVWCRIATYFYEPSYRFLPTK